MIWPELVDDASMFISPFWKWFQDLESLLLIAVWSVSNIISCASFSGRSFLFCSDLLGCFKTYGFFYKGDCLGVKIGLNVSNGFPALIFVKRSLLC